MTARRAGEYVYFENVMPEQLAAAGDFVVAEFKLDSLGVPSKGEVRARFPCPVYDGWNGALLGYNHCTFTLPITIDSYTSTRIEGTEYGYPPGSFRCKQCDTLSKPQARP